MEAKMANFVELRAGDPAPDFVLPASDGKRVSLKSALKTGPVVLSFLASNASRSLDGLSDLAVRAAQHGASYLLIVPGAAASSVSHCANILFDADLRIAFRYGLIRGPMDAPIPATFVIGGDGIVVLSLTYMEYRHATAQANVAGALAAMQRRV
jgi:peroxiredoxin